MKESTKDWVTQAFSKSSQFQHNTNKEYVDNGSAKKKSSDKGSVKTNTTTSREDKKNLVENSKDVNNQNLHMSQKRWNNKTT